MTEATMDDGGGADRARAAWRQLFHAYCHRIDQGTAEAIGRLFAPDARLVLAFDRDRVIAGRTDIVSWFADYMRTTRGSSWPNRHWIGELSLTAAGAAAAEGAAWVDASGLGRVDRRAVFYRGHYRDRIELRRGRWMFAERVIVLWDRREAAAAALARRGAEEETFFMDNDEVKRVLGVTDGVRLPHDFGSPSWLDGEGVPTPDEATAAAMTEAEQVLNRLARALRAPGAGVWEKLLAAGARLRLGGGPEWMETDDRAGRERVWQAAGAGGLRRQLLVPVIEIRGDRAEALAYLTLDERREDGAGARLTEGRWQARMARGDDGRWRVAELEERLFFRHETGSATKGGVS